MRAYRFPGVSKSLPRKPSALILYLQNLTPPTLSIVAGATGLGDIRYSSGLYGTTRRSGSCHSGQISRTAPFVEPEEGLAQQAGGDRSADQQGEVDQQ